MSLNLDYLKTAMNGIKQYIQSIQKKLEKDTDKKIKDNAPDWNQNDPEGKGYIQNRPFYTKDPNTVKTIPVEYVPREIFEQDYSAIRFGTGTNSTVVGNNTTASGNASHAEGQGTTASGSSSHAEGYNTTASGKDGYISASHAEGMETNASGLYSHAEGQETTASGDASHAEGERTIASEDFSHAEGYVTTASGSASHAEGHNTRATSGSSHAEGYQTNASGLYSHAEGRGTLANTGSQHVQGEFNIQDTKSTTTYLGNFAHIVGNGTSTSKRSNAHTLDWSGNAWFAGDVYVGSTSGTNKDDGSKKLATEEYVDGKISDKELILTSSTSGSTKKFKITVDDSGTISAPEVTT